MLSNPGDSGSFKKTLITQIGLVMRSCHLISGRSGSPQIQSGRNRCDQRDAEVCTQLSSSHLSHLFSHSAIVLIVAGGLIVVISFLGCCGAIRESYWMLNTVSDRWFANYWQRFQWWQYGGLIFLCLAAQGVGAYLAITYHYDVSNSGCHFPDHFPHCTNDRFCAPKDIDIDNFFKVISLDTASKQALTKILC